MEFSYKSSRNLKEPRMLYNKDHLAVSNAFSMSVFIQYYHAVGVIDLFVKSWVSIRDIVSFMVLPATPHVWPALMMWCIILCNLSAIVVAIIL
eukprot:Pgem_evm1s15903